jgi:hypothetical protein
MSIKPRATAKPSRRNCASVMAPRRCEPDADERACYDFRRDDDRRSHAALLHSVRGLLSTVHGGRRIRRLRLRAVPAPRLGASQPLAAHVRRTRLADAADSKVRSRHAHRRPRVCLRCARTTRTQHATLSRFAQCPWERIDAARARDGFGFCESRRLFVRAAATPHRLARHLAAAGTFQHAAHSRGRARPRSGDRGRPRLGCDVLCQFSRGTRAIRFTGVRRSGNRVEVSGAVPRAAGQYSFTAAHPAVG